MRAPTIAIHNHKMAEPCHEGCPSWNCPPTVVEPPHEQMTLPGAYVVGGHLFFRLRNGLVISCNCIGEPYASQVKDACDAYRIY